MSLEGQLLDRKSLRAVTGKSADWGELAKDCVAFANALGGRLLIGIEDAQPWPPAGQCVPTDLPDTLHRRIAELTINVSVRADVKRADNGGEFLELTVERSASVASTADGRYFLRIADGSKPVLGDEVMRLASERSALPWETLASVGVLRTQADPSKRVNLIAGLRASDRVKASVKEKSDDELMAHYLLTVGDRLTHLGVLCLGKQIDRARLGSAPVIQFIKRDTQEHKVNKLVWDDYTLSPMEMVDAVWRDVPDFREFYEVADGLFRTQVAAFDERVIRELLINALVHRPYTQRGDIYLNLYPDRLEIVNPGPLPLGVTPGNVLHASVRRNEHLARLCHDLKLMEREGSGFDAIYDVLLSQGRPTPVVEEGSDWVCVTLRRTLPDAQVLAFITKAGENYALSQRERITLGLLARHEALTAKELLVLLELSHTDQLRPWLNRLCEWALVGQSGRAQGTRYFVQPEVLRALAFPAITSLKRIEDHRLRALVLEDLQRYPGSSVGDVHQRIGLEIARRKLQTMLTSMVAEKLLRIEGVRRWTRYFLSSPLL
ncbi:ATP-binding protein [Rhodoferax sp.]|uniref:ATP-binding protein n=1 Tax=Rhodoferax sp. TaxID=50421 RepID=UPI0026351367|nr:ATP-binding protein [Rhodoferax sp.]MDD2810067.1 ATP-binding protein [Rhodoferax sp.]MDD4944085.1 ATP-binding protein [Rhodoferax sp.]